MNSGPEDEDDFEHISQEISQNESEKEDEFEYVSLEYTSPQKAVEEIYEILTSYIKQYQDDPSSWAREVHKQRTCFQGYVNDIQEQSRLKRRQPLTTLEIKEYVLNNLANAFISKFKKIISSQGNSILRRNLIDCANAWKIPEQAPKNKKTPSHIKK